MKTQRIEWEKIFANNETDKQTKNTCSSIKKKKKKNPQQKNPIKNWTEALDRHFSRENKQMTKKACENMPNITN